MDSFSLDHLSSVEFEEFCFDLLSALNCRQINWRKGTGTQASPADQGRDIECSFAKAEPDGGTTEERWFVECKHYKEGVPPAKIESALAWASSERPNVLLLIASNALSNSCKTFLRNYEQNNRPTFRIKIWEHKDLEKLTVGRPDLLRKYRVVPDFPFLQILHPAHIMFMREPPLNSLGYFFELIEQAGPHHFQDALSFVYLLILKPAVKTPTDGNQTLRDLLDGPVSYVDFKAKCLRLATVVEESFIVRAVVAEGLTDSFGYGDTTNTGRLVGSYKHLIHKMEEDLKANSHNGIFNEEDLLQMKARMAQIPENVKEGYRRYVLFCEKIVAPLFSEQIEFPPEVMAQTEKMLGKKIQFIKKDPKKPSSAGQ